MIEAISTVQPLEGLGSGLNVSKVQPGVFEQLVEGVNQVNGLQLNSGQVKADYVAGVNNVDMLDVMVASSSASVAFTGLVEVRNKVQEAYKEIMNMAI